MCTEKGKCYFPLNQRNFGSFCFESQEWSWFGEIPTPVMYDRMYLAEFNGDLLAVLEFDNCILYKYDENERGWIEQKSLGDEYCLFCLLISAAHI